MVPGQREYLAESGVTCHLGGSDSCQLGEPCPVSSLTEECQQTRLSRGEQVNNSKTTNSHTLCVCVGRKVSAWAELGRQSRALTGFSLGFLCELIILHSVPKG